MNSLLLRLSLVSLFCAIAAATARAEVKPNSLFSDGMVLQRGRAVPVWGEAGENEKITVTFGDQKVNTVAHQGKWRVDLAPLKEGGPFTMTIAGDNTITIKNVLVGEVWLCSGQSNMGFTLDRAANAKEAIAAAGDSELRLFKVPSAPSDVPLTNTKGKWSESTPESAKGFSAVAYFFGRDLRKALKVPVGLIESAVGGTPAEAWTARTNLESVAELKPILDRQAEAEKEYKTEGAAARRKQAAEAAKKAKAEGKSVAKAPAEERDPATSPRRPACLYNGMIVPLQPYAIAGAIWYQGEGNSGRAQEYRTLFPTMIRNWRAVWNQGEFPFLFVQIAPMDRMSPEIREAQLYTWQNVPRTAMIVTADVGEANDIHPKRKEPVGARLALAARALAYDEKREYSGPVYESMKVDGSKAVLSFTHLGRGLTAKDGDLTGFTMAGADNTFHPATAKIEGDNVIVTCPEVKAPKAVRYGWTNSPVVNLFNKDDLPASPFRTDAP